MRIVHRPVMAVLSGEAIGVFVHVEGADRHRTGGNEARDDRRVGDGRRTFGVDPGSGDRDDALQVEQILDCEGHAGERALLGTGGAPCIDRACRRERAFGGDRGEAVERRIALYDAC